MRIHPWFAGFPFVLKLWEIFILLIKFNGEIWRRIGDIWRKYFANLAPSKIPPPTPSTYSLLSIVLVGENLPFGFVMLILIILIIYTDHMLIWLDHFIFISWKCGSRSEYFVVRPAPENILPVNFFSQRNLDVWLISKIFLHSIFSVKISKIFPPFNIRCKKYKSWMDDSVMPTAWPC